MKILPLFLAIMMWHASASAFADGPATGEYYPGDETYRKDSGTYDALPETKKVVAPIPTQKLMREKHKAELLNMNPLAMRASLRDLERRVLQLEKDNRLKDERIRNLDRSVDDLKRRRID